MKHTVTSWRLHKPQLKPITTRTMSGNIHTPRKLPARYGGVLKHDKFKILQCTIPKSIQRYYMPEGYSIGLKGDQLTLYLNG